MAVFLRGLRTDSTVNIASREAQHRHVLGGAPSADSLKVYAEKHNKIRKTN
jgi:hypothetical protein